jgi:hypothetical protein
MSDSENDSAPDMDFGAIESNSLTVDEAQKLNRQKIMGKRREHGSSESLAT